MLYYSQEEIEDITIMQKPEIIQTSNEQVNTQISHNNEPIKNYDSNPFTLAFNSFGRMFDRNVGWGIVFLVISFFGAGTQFLGDLGSQSEPNSSTSYDALSKFNSLSPEQATATGVIVLVAVVIIAALLLIGLTVQIFITGMFVHVALESEKGRKVPFSEAFNATKKRFWRLLLSQLLAFVKICLWTLLLIIPGIIAALRYSLLTYVIMDEPDTNKGVVASHTRTKALVKGRLVEVLGLFAAAYLIPFIGSLLQLTGSSAQYRQLAASYHNGNPVRPPIHWANYVTPLIYVLLFVIFIGFIFGLYLLLALASS